MSRASSRIGVLFPMLGPFTLKRENGDNFHEILLSSARVLQRACFRPANPQLQATPRLPPDKT